MSLSTSVPEIPDRHPRSASIQDECDPTIESLLACAEAIVERSISQWRRGAAFEVSWMIREWSESGHLADDKPLLRILGAIAGDMEVCASRIGYWDIADAARDLTLALLQIEILYSGAPPGSEQASTVAACLKSLDDCIAEGLRIEVPPEGPGSDNLAA